MKTRIKSVLLWPATLAFLLMFAGSAMAANPLPVFVSVVPQKYFVQQIGKDLVDVQVMVQPGASPATYEPKPRQMALLSKARLYFAIGVPFENAWLEKIAAASPAMTVVHTEQGIKKLAMAAHHHDEDEGDEHHGEDHDAEEHEHGGLDPHIWLSPALVKVQSATVLAALKTADPAHAAQYEANFKGFMDQIDALDADLRQVFAGKEGLQFMVFHPAWGYFAQAYGLKQVPIEIEGKDPKPAQLGELISHAKENGIRVIFAQPQFSTKSAKVVATSINGQVAYADPLAEDWMGNLRLVADSFKAALR